MKKSLCCISLTLQDQGVKSSTMTRSRFLALDRVVAEQTVADRTLNNIRVVKQTIQYCISKQWNYRISSNLMPLATLPEANLVLENAYNYNLIDNEFKQVSKLIKDSGIRCSTHPDQFVVPASANPSVVQKSILELEMHADMMDRFGLPQDYTSPINIHMNCHNGELKDIATRFIKAFKQMSPSVQKRLVLENEDKPNSWKITELYEYIYTELGIPITYDSLHYRCNPGDIDVDQAVATCIETWGKYTPLFHYSNGKSNPTDRSHSDYVYDLHAELVNNNVDVEFEFKAKDHAISKFEVDFKI